MDIPDQDFTSITIGTGYNTQTTGKDFRTFQPKASDQSENGSKKLQSWALNLNLQAYSDLYNELFEFFEKNPGKLYDIKPRQLEYYVGEIFRNRGYEVYIGRGTNDGGIDLRLYQKTEIDQITTLVQVKKYTKTLPIRLDAVAALYGHVEAEKAQKGLFITTSRYLPSAKALTGRLSKQIMLSDSNDLVNWSKNKYYPRQESINY